MEIGGQAALVSGGASGLGRATARVLAAAGVKVAILDVHAEAAAEAATEIGGLALPCDVTDAASVERAVATYLFNSQLLPRREGGMLLVAPAECRSDGAVGAFLERLVSGTGPIREVLTFDLKQSMQNGGGPACVRLRVALNAAERAAIRAGIWLDTVLYAELIAWVERHYRDRLAPTDLADPTLLDEGRRALDELTGLLRLGSVYPFQL